MNEQDLTSAVRFDQDAQISQKPTGIGCPSCRIELLIGDVHGSQFAGCPGCGGMLLQQETFASLIAHLRSVSPAPAQMPEPMDASQLKVRRLCPTCDAILDTHPYAGPGNSVIDSCTACGLVWFDQGEFDKLVAAPGRR